MKKDASRFSPKGVLFHRTFFTAPFSVVPADFIGCSAEAAKSCFCGVSVAFGLGEFHRAFGRGRKILLLRRDCCLWSWRVS